MYRVENVKGSSNEMLPHGYSSWIEYWEKRSYRKAQKCSRIDCNQTKNIEGAHVYIIGENVEKEYITPLCREHNNPNVTEEFDVNETLVPIDISDNFIRNEIIDGIRRGTQYDINR
jgi:hypothetical protein